MKTWIYLVSHLVLGVFTFLLGTYVCDLPFTEETKDVPPLTYDSDVELSWDDVEPILEVHCTGRCHSVEEVIPSEEIFLEGHGPEMIQSGTMPPREGYEDINVWNEFDRAYVEAYLRGE